MPEPETNIVFLELPDSLAPKAGEVLSKFESDLGVRLGQLDYNILRAVTHLDIPAKELEVVLAKKYKISL